MAAVIACCVILPSSAGAALSLPAPADQTLAAVDTTVAAAVAPVTKAPTDVADAALQGSSEVSRPGGTAERHPVADTVAPIAHTATAPVEAAQAGATASKHLGERARPRISHIGATSSGGRMSSGRVAHGHGLHGATPSPSSERSVPAHRAAPVGTDRPAGTPAATHAAAQPGPGSSPASSAPGAAASGGAGGLFFGGGFALLVASLLLAGPGLRRQLAELPAVCRPAAFLVVLERPG